MSTAATLRTGLVVGGLMGAVVGGLGFIVATALHANLIRAAGGDVASIDALFSASGRGAALALGCGISGMLFGGRFGRQRGGLRGGLVAGVLGGMLPVAVALVFVIWFV